MMAEHWSVHPIGAVFNYSYRLPFHSVLSQGWTASDVKSSRPKWPRGQNFGLDLDLKHLASAWPQTRCLIM